MGNISNVPKIAYDMWWGWRDIGEETNVQKKQIEPYKKKIEEEMTNILKAGLDPDMWDLLEFIEGQGQDTSDIKRNIAHLLKHHKEMNYHQLT